ncbi:hypothetical protein PBRA_003900 [Plasmodiophora brassicae]|uniref:Yeast cell wall synthesis Kre9/Knh1-like N-terminal domain-containing protein n=1 Tax=Plasmodiophora brassicae TaxID=37360 RepID=A0A0G4IIY9_PLABS|nr:hypothetical protein PBRA_003900 [Plasmodiophora brassicae]
MHGSLTAVSSICLLGQVVVVVATAASISIVTPTSATIQAGSALNVTYAASAVDKVDILLYQGGDVRDVLAQALPTSTTTFVHNLATDVQTGPGYAIVVRSTDLSVSVRSPSFGVAGPLLLDDIPGGVARASDIVPITWTSTISDPVVVDVLAAWSSNVVAVVGATTADQGAIAWSVPATSLAPATAAYQIRIRSTTRPAISNTGNPFTVLATLIVETPTATDSWSLSSTRTITWNGGLEAGPVTIQVTRNGQRVRTLTTSAPNTGRYVWRIDPTLPVGPLYAIVVQPTGQPGRAATSAPFNLIADTVIT